MFYGTTITHGVDPWQVFQRVNGRARVRVGGLWRLEDGAARAGVSAQDPSIRLVREEDGSCVFDWTRAQSITDGRWETEFDMPEGGLYRLETCLDAVSAKSGEHWRFHGDMRMHLGCGDVFVIAGQSNAAGYGKGIAWDAPDVRVHVKRNSGLWDMAAHPLNDATDAADCPNAPMGQVGTSPFLSFGRRHADFTGCPVGLIPAAQGGSPLKAWDPARDGYLYNNMIAKLHAVGRAAAILWYQGCTDASNGEADIYFEGFERLVNATRREAGFDIPFYTFQLAGVLGRAENRGWDTVRQAQRRAAREITGVYILSAAGSGMADNIHISPSSNVLLGEQLCYVMDRGFRAPDLISARLRGGKIELKYENVRGELNVRDPLARGFALRDAFGEVAIAEISAMANTVTLTPARALCGRAFVSAGCGSMPDVYPLMDSGTGLCALSFFDEPVSAEK
ncbi:MAG: hypothetical protein II697_02010 [Clostridia bacterium]|nr:hypothetical protein [Clostridia bacterium]